MIIITGEKQIFSEEKADEYDSWYETPLGAFVDEVETELAFSLFQPRRGSRVLDAGCGTGNFTLKLARIGCEVVGIDISSHMLERAREKVRDYDEDLPVSFRRMDVTDLDFSAESFDDVFSMATAEFIPAEEKEVYIEEMLRVVKPGGRVLVGTINRDSEWGRMYLRRAESPDSVFHDADIPTPEELNEIAADRFVKSRECLFIPPDAEEEEISWQREKELSSEKRGGFFCSLWREPAP